MLDVIYASVVIFILLIFFVGSIFLIALDSYRTRKCRIEREKRYQLEDEESDRILKLDVSDRDWYRLEMRRANGADIELENIAEAMEIEQRVKEAPSYSDMCECEFVHQDSKPCRGKRWTDDKIDEMLNRLDL